MSESTGRRKGTSWRTTIIIVTINVARFPKSIKSLKDLKLLFYDAPKFFPTLKAQKYMGQDDEEKGGVKPVLESLIIMQTLPHHLSLAKVEEELMLSFPYFLSTQ